MSTTETIEYRYIEQNTRVGRTGVCTRLSEEGAVAIAVEALKATELPDGDYIYFASEAQEHWVADARELMVLGAALHCRAADQFDADCYSLWCQDYGRQATDAETAEVAE